MLNNHYNNHEGLGYIVVDQTREWGYDENLYQAEYCSVVIVMVVLLVL